MEINKRFVFNQNNQYIQKETQGGCPLLDANKHIQINIYVYVAVKTRF